MRTPGLFEIKIHRLETKNAIPDISVRAIGRAVERASNDPNVKVILWYSSEKVFSAGNDLTELLTTTKDRKGAEFSVIDCVGYTVKSFI